MSNNLVTEAYLAANFTVKDGITAGTDNHTILTCDEIKARYRVKISPSTGKFCPKQSELTAAITPDLYTQRYICERYETSVGIRGLIKNFGSMASEIISCGVCYAWFDSEDPQLGYCLGSVEGSEITTDENGYGVFTTYLTGLTENRLYKARVYMICDAGTFYGPVIDENFENYVDSAIDFMPSNLQLGDSVGGGVVCNVLVSGSSYTNLVTNQTIAEYNPNIQKAMIMSGIIYYNGTYYHSWGDSIIACDNADFNDYTDWDLRLLDPNWIITMAHSFPDLFADPNGTYWTAFDGSTDLANAYSLQYGNIFLQDDDTLLRVIACRLFEGE